MRRSRGVFGLRSNKKARKEEQCKVLIQDVRVQIDTMKQLLGSQVLLDNAIVGDMDRQNQIVAHRVGHNIRRYRRTSNFKTLSNVVKTFDLNRINFPYEVDNHNKEVAQRIYEKAHKYVGVVESQDLDVQQLQAILDESKSQLVIAGAGTGKTTTILGKVKYILNKSMATEDEILVLSFTNASAKEMKERLMKETNRNIEVSTFHKLAINIITAVEGKKPRITNINLKSYISEVLRTLMRDRSYLLKLNAYLVFHQRNGSTEFDFDSEEEYTDFLKYNPPITLKKEIVKSYGELDIANFLTQNGIRYWYEAPYHIDTRSEEYGQYQPDFFLPDYNIFIEYFAINRNHEVPSYFNGKPHKSASEAYNESMAWKKTLHKENNTILVSCYAYEKFEGELIVNLSSKLEELGVLFCPLSNEEILGHLKDKGPSILDGFVELVEMVINLIKSNNYSLDTVRSMAHSKVTHILLDLVEPIFNAYNQSLRNLDEIDFNDMINHAAYYIRNNQYVHTYKFVIIDEYQDISKARYGLIKAMRDSKDFNLFCVGDDWQSIYRFAGSDIGFILNFDTYWGFSSVSKIETTYRFAQDLTDISGTFIMQNPNQVKKDMIGNRNSRVFPLSEISAYNEGYLSEFLYEKLMALPTNSTVFLIGRYKHDRNYIVNNSKFTIKYDPVKNVTLVRLKGRDDMKITFITAHKSKGLQADYVFILNNKNTVMGFPSKVSDDPIIDLLLENADNFKHSEERRLFYVALTRARVKVTLMTLKGHESKFVQELRSRYGRALRDEAFVCPRCGGSLYKKEGRFGAFIGCSNYKHTGCSFTRNLEKQA